MILAAILSHVLSQFILLIFKLGSLVLDHHMLETSLETVFLEKSLMSKVISNHLARNLNEIKKFRGTRLVLLAQRVVIIYYSYSILKAMLLTFLFIPTNKLLLLLNTN